MLTKKSSNIFLPRRLDRPDLRSHQEKILSLVEEKLKIFFDKNKIKAKNFDIISTVADGSKACLAFLIVASPGFYKDKNSTFNMYNIWIRGNSIALEVKDNYTIFIRNETIMFIEPTNSADFVFEKAIDFFKFLK